MQIAELKDKKILILGLGNEGLSTFRFLRRKFPAVQLSVADRREFSEFQKSVQKDLQNAQTTPLLGKKYLDTLTNFEIIIKAPGISPYQSPIPEALKQGIQFTSQTELFFDNFSGRIIGVTGTKGKSTTTSLIYHILKSSGMDIEIGGNIGLPALELLETNCKWAVLELSSHQLWHLTKSPHIAVFLNIFKDHLDYSDFPNYFSAKKNIARFQIQSDHFVYNINFSELTKFANNLKSKIWTFGNTSYSPVAINNKMLPGIANFQNTEATKIVSRILGVTDEVFQNHLQTFIPLPGRLEKLGVFDGLTVYEDYLATIPEATLNALDALSGSIRCLFLGGHERKQNYQKVLSVVLRQQIPLIILFPANGLRIQAELESMATTFKPRTIIVSSMKEAVTQMFTHSLKPGIALFSTGAPSFGMFKDYKDRSLQLRYWLHKLTDSKPN
ncbi:MAG: UDP-N-acetylmuramoyl-L-alanine--D-glutamate ligase [Patescibacteria group bacterium]